MVKIGDRVRVTIRGPNVLAGTAQTNTAAGTYTIGEGVSFDASGKIIEDLGNSWLVEFDSPLLGSKRMVIPKSRVM
ncbi:MAG: hypothetical protein HYX84_02430 [Chloroflexi bacterium]|nr:hypothetical protein [Chloroflexota bacterium]